jgi:thiamine-monophosphate kinase
MAQYKERDLIEHLRQSLPSDNKVTIGDDCAVYKISKKKWGLFTTDISVEGVHFDLSYSSPYSIGVKAMESNLSDIAAMGGKPRYAFVSIVIPHYCDKKFIDEIYRGFNDSTLPHEAYIAGGDLSTGKNLIINICLYGETMHSPVLRSGAKNDDYIYLTGYTGLSSAGLELLQEQKKGNYPALIQKHREPKARLDIIDVIMQYNPTAMIDISDSLGSEINHICDQSNCGCIVKAERIPRHKELIKFCKKFHENIVPYLFMSGEEYELLFTSPSSIVHEDITCIGQITAMDRILYENGEQNTLPADGFQHFFRS